MSQLHPVIQRPLFLVSACLVGLSCRYDGKIRPSRECLQQLEQGIWIPFCPEQMGGLSTPRCAADLHKGDGHAVLAGQAQVITRDGRDVSPQFIAGARQSLLLAQQQPITTVFLKSGSPSCGLHGVIGVTAALLARHGFQLVEMRG